MRTVLKALAVSVGLLILVFGLKTLWDDKQELKKAGAVNRELPLVLKGPEMHQYFKKDLDYLVESEKVEIFQVSKRLRFKKFRAIFKSKSGEDIEVNADYALYKIAREWLQLSGNVTVAQLNQLELKTDELFFQMNKRVLYNESSVFIKHNRTNIRGSHIHLNLNTGSYKLKNPEIVLTQQVLNDA